VLELGKPGTHGVDRETMPVVRDGALVGSLRAAPYREQATARAGDREWVFSRGGRELVGRWAVEPEQANRFSARPVSLWKGTWTADLDGTAVEIRPGSWWKGDRRYVVDGREIGASGNTSRWVPRPTLDLDEGVLDLDAQVFLLWVELTLRRRNAGAAAGGAAAAGAAG
jgi:hypothetical protein